MATVKLVPKRSLVRLSYIPRRLIGDKEKIKPVEHKQEFHLKSNLDAPSLKALTSIPSQSVLSSIIQTQPEVQNIEKNNPQITNSARPRTESNETLVSQNTYPSNATSPQQIDHNTKDALKQSPTRRKTALKVIIGILVVVGIIAAVVIPSAILLGPNEIDTTLTTTTSTTPSPCLSTTCIGKETSTRSSIVTVLYAFDGNATDSTGRFSGIAFNSPTFVNQSYTGSRALSLNNPGTNQYVEIPYVDLSKRSFTIQTWLFFTATSILNDYGLFSLCDFNSTCLSISLRNGRFVVAFDSMNTTNTSLTSTAFIPTREWIHLTVVYDAVLYQQQIYVNGRISSVSTGMIAPYQRNSTNSTATIGASKSSAYGWSYFQGRIDHFTISADTARTACQIYNDATLTAYFPFDTIDSFNDYSYNLFKSTASNVTIHSVGRIRQAAYFLSNTSYFQVQCFPIVRNVSTANPPFTFSLWLNPSTSTNGGSIIHISSLANGNGSICYDLLALSNTGALVIQSMGPTSTVVGWQGPILPRDTWTHVALIYSQEDGLRLFINAQLRVTSSLASVPYNLIRWDFPLFVTLGNNSPLGSSATLGCPSGAIPFIPGPYRGGIDDFRLYSRELDTQEICALANSQ